MKTETIQQELLLVTTSTFFKKQWCVKNASESNYQSNAEHLEEACWNGILDELLPEVMEKSSTGKKLFLWNIRNGQSLLQVEMSESAVMIEKEFSIDPLLFL
jgi:hypothetical protein